MIRAAGILFLAPGGLALYLKRGPGGDYPGYWCFPGGRQEDNETLIECAIREAKEETGRDVPGTPTPWTRQVAASFLNGTISNQPPGDGVAVASLPGAVQPGEEVDYTTFVVQVPEQFVPAPDAEHVGYAWAPADQAPQPLHPGCAIAIDRFGMDELGVARAMAAGRLSSPQRYENVSLFAVRVTGTGMAFRRSLNEFVWRDPSLYMNDEFLARCNGLAVILEHPKRAVLTSAEFNDRVVGSILLPYLVPDAQEVWGIAKIYDDLAISMMTEDQLSTSPAVVFRDPDVNVKLELETGEKLLIEGKPSLLDHLAICERGVWDKGGEPTGVLTTGKDTMTEEEKRAAEAKARADADEAAKANNDKLDRLLSGIAGLNTRFDASDKRMDALDNRLGSVTTRVDSLVVRADEDEEENKYSKRKDGESDDDYKKRHDAEEGAEVEARVKKGEAKEAAADKAKRNRADAEEKEKGEVEEKKKADAEAKARADADFNARVANAVKAHAPAQMTDADFRARATAQAKADTVYQAFGDSAPRPLDGESLLAYRRRLVTKLKEHSPSWKGVDLAVIADETAFGVAETQIYSDAMRAAENPKDLPEGQLRAVTRNDSTGRQITTFHGEPIAWMQNFSGNRRRLAGIRNRDR